MEFLPDGLLLLSSTLTILAANRTFLNLFGFSRKTVLGKPLHRVLPSVEFAGWVREKSARNGSGSATLLFPDGDKETLRNPVRVSLSRAPHSGGKFRILLRLWGLAQEPPERCRGMIGDRRFRSLAEAIASGVFLLDKDGLLVSTNEAANRMFGLDSLPPEGCGIGSLLPSLPGSAFFPAEKLPTGPFNRRRSTGRRLDGTEFPVEVAGCRLGKEDGHVTILVVTELPGMRSPASPPAEEALSTSPARYLGRSALATRLGEILEAPTESPWKKGALISMDIDRFKGVNDLLGNESGDALLSEVGDRLSACVRKGDLVVRTGGDEFMILLPGLDDRETTKDVSEKILDAIARPFEFDGTPVFVNASIGAALWPEDGATSDLLLRRVDNALYEAKELGNTCVVYHPAEAPRIDRKFELERELRRAIDRGEFSLHFQPQVEIGTRKLTGAEALIRWNHPERGLVSPEYFIPVAESTGLIVPIGAWVIRSVCDHLRDWTLAGRPSLRLTVNVSVRQLERGNLTDIFRRALLDSGVDGRQLEVEITESLLMKRTLTSMDLGELAEMGIQTSIDDFGTGYSSLSYLTRLHVHKLKIDRSFITSLPTDPNIRAITTAIITMARALRLRTIAEGVETEEQLAILESLGCHEVQGYYFSPPLPAPEFLRWSPPGGVFSPPQSIP